MQAPVARQVESCIMKAQVHVGAVVGSCRSKDSQDKPFKQWETSASNRASPKSDS